MIYTGKIYIKIIHVVQAHGIGDCQACVGGGINVIAVNQKGIVVVGHDSGPGLDITGARTQYVVRHGDVMVENGVDGVDILAENMVAVNHYIVVGSGIKTHAGVAVQLDANVSALNLIADNAQAIDGSGAFGLVNCELEVVSRYRCFKMVVYDVDAVATFFETDNMAVVIFQRQVADDQPFVATQYQQVAVSAGYCHFAAVS